VDSLLTSVMQALEGGSILALGAAFLWGILSVLLSPCHLGSIPLIVGFISGQSNLSSRRAFGLSSLFALGILGSIAIIGVITTLLGRMLGDVGAWSIYLVAAIFILVGLYLLDIIPQFSGSVIPHKFRGKGVAASLFLGLIYGLALGPCSFAFMAPMLALTFYSGSEHTLFGWFMLAIYGIGHCAVIAIAGGSVELVQRYLNWGERSKGTLWLRRASGILVIAFAFYLILKP